MAGNYVYRSRPSRGATKLAVETYAACCHSARVLNTAQLLARLDDAKVRNVDMEKVLGLPSSRVAEIRAGRRQIKLDEAAKLVEAFNLEPEKPQAQITPLPTPVARLLVLHVAGVLGADLPDELVADLAADLRAFALFSADPQVRDSVEAAEGFLKALRIRRKVPIAGQPAPRQRPSH